MLKSDRSEKQIVSCKGNQRDSVWGVLWELGRHMATLDGFLLILDGVSFFGSLLCVLLVLFLAVFSFVLGLVIGLVLGLVLTSGAELRLRVGRCLTQVGAGTVVGRTMSWRGKHVALVHVRAVRVVGLLGHVSVVAHAGRRLGRHGARDIRGHAGIAELLVLGHPRVGQHGRLRGRRGCHHLAGLGRGRILDHGLLILRVGAPSRSSPVRNRAVSATMSAVAATVRWVRWGVSTPRRRRILAVRSLALPVRGLAPLVTISRGLALLVTISHVAGLPVRGLALLVTISHVAGLPAAGARAWKLLPGAARRAMRSCKRGAPLSAHAQTIILDDHPILGTNVSTCAAGEANQKRTQA